MHFWWENAGELKITELTLFWQLRAYNQLLNLLHYVMGDHSSWLFGLLMPEIFLRKM